MTHHARAITRGMGVGATYAMEHGMSPMRFVRTWALIATAAAHSKFNTHSR